VSSKVLKVQTCSFNFISNTNRAQAHIKTKFYVQAWFNFFCWPFPNFFM